MKKRKVIGYVVVSDNPPGVGVYGLGLSSGAEERKVLWFGSYVTLFSTRARAVAALKRTRKYGDLYGCAWPWINTSFVKAVVSE